MSKVEIKVPSFRLCTKCQLMIHILSIKFDVSHNGTNSVDIIGMCGHGHKFGFYDSSEYRMEIDLNTIVWSAKF